MELERIMEENARKIAEAQKKLVSFKPIYFFYIHNV